MITKNQVYESPAGHHITVHDISDGEVFYQAYAPGVESRGALDNLCRMSLEHFEAQIEAAGAKLLPTPKATP